MSSLATDIDHSYILLVVLAIPHHSVFFLLYHHQVLVQPVILAAQFLYLFP
jgi:hypothetical protein